MVDYICPRGEVLQLYRKHKSDFNFNLRSDDEFIVFLLDTASRVLSIAQQLTPVLEAVSCESDTTPQTNLMNDTLRNTTHPERTSKTTQQDTTISTEFSSADKTLIILENNTLIDDTGLSPLKSDPEFSSQEDSNLSLLAKEIESVANSLTESNDEFEKELGSCKMETNYTDDHTAMVINNNDSDNIDTVALAPQSEITYSNCRSNNNVVLSSSTGYSMLEMSSLSVNNALFDVAHNILKDIKKSPSILASPGNATDFQKKDRDCKVKSIVHYDSGGMQHNLTYSKQRRCKICGKIHRRSCSICDVGLCKEECFKNFHANHLNYRPYVDQFKSFGRHHRSRKNVPMIGKLKVPFSYPVESLNKLCNKSSFFEECSEQLAPSSTFITANEVPINDLNYNHIGPTITQSSSETLNINSPIIKTEKLDDCFLSETLTPGSLHTSINKSSQKFPDFFESSSS